MPKLNVIITSVREKRVGKGVARWFTDRAKAHGAFDVELVDLGTVNLPLLSEPEHPRKRKYSQAATKAWSASVDAADAFVFVTPEYNYGMPPALLNALDHLYQEWLYKPAGFVSYGGISGGTRSVQMAKSVLTTLKMMPLPEAVNIPFVTTMVKEDGSFEGNEKHVQAAAGMLDELARWTGAMAVLRAGA